MAKIEQATNVNLVSRISAGTYIKGEIISPNDMSAAFLPEPTLRAR